MNHDVQESQAFRKFDHVEKGKHRAVSGITEGTCHIFPKIDGTNASIWAEMEGDQYLVRAGSRKKMLCPVKGDDNAGFRKFIEGDSDAAANLRLFALANPELIVYGEWLVPHSIKTYVEDAWRKFYVFDVYSRATKNYLPYDVYADLLKKAGVDTVVPPLAVLENPTGPELDELVDENNYLLPEGEVGEGIVVKNYGWVNSWDSQPWMKVIVDGFHDRAAKPAVGFEAGATEREIAEAFVTEALVRKNIAKNVVELANNLKVEPDADTIIAEHKNKIIPMTLGRVFQDIIEEEMGAIVKKFKKPTIDFKKLNAAVTRQIKTMAPELF